MYQTSINRHFRFHLFKFKMIEKNFVIERQGNRSTVFKTIPDLI